MGEVDGAKRLAGALLQISGVIFLVYLALFAYVDGHPGTRIAGLEKIVLAFSALFAIGAVVMFFYELVLGMSSRLKRGRCVRCGAPAEPGLLYCKKHLEEARKEMIERQLYR